jgi:hypothetical protein
MSEEYLGESYTWSGEEYHSFRTKPSPLFSALFQTKVAAFCYTIIYEHPVAPTAEVVPVLPADTMVEMNVITNKPEEATS